MAGFKDNAGHQGLSIFFRLLIALLAIVVLISGALTAVFYIYSKKSLEKQTTEYVLQQFETVSYHFRTELRAALVKDLQLLASNSLLDEYITSISSEREAAARAVEHFFFESLKYSRNYERITFLNAAGKETVKVDWSGRVRVFHDRGGRELFTRMRSEQQGRIDVGNPVLDQYGNLLFTAGIYKIDPDSNTFGGVVMIDYNLREFIAYLDRIAIFNENPLWVFAPDGGVLKQPMNKKAVLDPRSTLGKDFQKEPLLAMVKDGMLVYQDFYVNPDRPLLRLAISIPSALLLQDVQSVLRFFLMVFAVSLIVISGLAYFFAGYLSRPIIELAKTASLLAKGDLAARVKGRSTGEVQMLIDSFNRMAGDLERTTVSRNYMDDIIGSMRDALIVVSPGGKITRVNVAACFLLGYDEAELTGMRMDRVIVEEPGSENRTLALVLDQSSVNMIEKICLTKRGKRIPILFSASVMRGADGGVQGVVCVAQDITERKKDEETLKSYAEELQEINEELKSFTYIVSHDLRAPLVNIKGFSEELIFGIREIGPVLDKYVEGFPPEERQKFNEVLKKDIPEALKFIGSSVSRMDNLINAVLKLSRLGRRDLDPERVDVQELVRGITNSLAHQIEERGIAVSAKNLPVITVDRTALEQIFGNLLDNAIKYLEPGRPGIIEVTSTRINGELEFHVSDNGRGMAKEDIPKAFDLFRRVGKQNVPGEGMGLAYVKTLVRHLGGRIWCESTLGTGTRFNFTLPASPDGFNDSHQGLEKEEVE